MTTFLPTPGTETMIATVEDISARLKAVKQAYDDYDPKCNRRAAWEHLREVQRNLGALGRWLDGTNDTPIVFMASAATQESRDAYRTHYGAESLVAAIHHLLVAEYFAGIRTQESVEPLDPWRYVDGKSQGEAERLRLTEGLSWTYPTSVLP